MTTETTATTINRSFKGTEYAITDNGDGTFTWEGTSYTSATAVASAIRATHGITSSVNGRAWLGLTSTGQRGGRRTEARLDRVRKKIAKLTADLTGLVIEAEALSAQVVEEAQAAVKAAEEEAKTTAEAAKAKVAEAKTRKGTAAKTAKAVKGEAKAATEAVKAANEATR